MEDLATPACGMIARSVFRESEENGLLPFVLALRTVTGARIETRVATRRGQSETHPPLPSRLESRRLFVDSHFASQL
jgi:hypothetical protein